MLIRTIKLKNFRQYKDAEIEFSLDPDKNTTVILGENGYGKTTLIRAFNWCLYQTNDFKHNKILLNSQVADDMPCNSEKVVKVTLTIEHRGLEYIIVTQERYHKNSDQVVVKMDRSPKTTVSVGGENENFKDYEGSNAHNIIERILKEEMKEFFFYDGESNGIDEISNKKSLKNAISVMMKIKNLEILRDYFDEKKPYVFKSLNNKIVSEKLNNEEELRLKHEKEFDFEIENLKRQSNIVDKEIQENEKTVFDNDNEILKLKDQIDENKKLVLANEQSRDYQLEIDSLQKKNKEIFDNYERNYAEYVDKLGNGRKNDCHTLLNALFEKCYSKYNIKELKNKTSFRNEDSLANITEDAVNQLIKRGRCLCGAPIKTGNDAYIHLMEARNHMEPHDYAAYLNDFIELQSNKFDWNRDSLNSFIDSFNNQFLNDLDNYSANIDRIKELKNKISGSLNVGKIQEKIEDINRQIGRLESDNESIKNNKLEELGAKKSNIQGQINDIVNKKEKSRVMALCLNLSKDIYHMAYTHVETSSRKIRDVLEDETNNLFKKMYHGDRSIEIDKDFHVKTITDKKELDNSTGIDTVKNFAFVAGMMKTAKQHIADNKTFKVTTDDVYPLVIDAPFSNTDEQHIKNICDVLPESCDQLIMCMINKDYKVAKDDLDNKVGKKYQIIKISETEDRIEEVD